MKVRLPSLALLLLGLAASIRTAGAEGPVKPATKKITVTGTATVAVKPDAARLTFGVHTTMPDLKGARTENDRQVKKLVASLSTLGYTGLEIQAVPGSVNSVTTNDPAGPAGPVMTRQVQTTITVLAREKDVEKLREMVIKLADTASENGAASSNVDDGLPLALRGRVGRAVMDTSQGPQIEWLTQQTGEARREAIKKAVADARANALAAVPDAKLEQVEVTVTVFNTDSVVRQRTRSGFYASAVDPSPQSVTVEVQVTFAH
jgi:uncharacterized protein YggE